MTTTHCRHCHIPPRPRWSDAAQAQLDQAALVETGQPLILPAGATLEQLTPGQRWVVQYVPPHKWATYDRRLRPDPDQWAGDGPVPHLYRVDVPTAFNLTRPGWIRPWPVLHIGADARALRFAIMVGSITAIMFGILGAPDGMIVTMAGVMTISAALIRWATT